MLGPERFFFYNLFQSERTGAPLSFRNRAAGSIDAYAAAVGRWLVTRDGFDFLLLYLSDYDYASHAAGPDAATSCSRGCDDAIGGLVRAAGGLDEFLEPLRRDRRVRPRPDAGVARSRGSATGFGTSPETLVAASNRAAHVYRHRRRTRRSARTLAERLDGEPSVEVALFREDGAVVARRDGAELRLDGDGVAARRRPGDPRPSRRGRRARPQRSDARTPARWSSPRRRAGSSRISAAATTAAAARTAPSSRATRSSPS